VVSGGVLTIFLIELYRLMTNHTGTIYQSDTATLDCESYILVLAPKKTKTDMRLNTCTMVDVATKSARLLPFHNSERRQISDETIPKWGLRSFIQQHRF
jgi:hypothetical protein